MIQTALPEHVGVSRYLLTRCLVGLRLRSQVGYVFCFMDNCIAAKVPVMDFVLLRFLSG